MADGAGDAIDPKPGTALLDVIRANIEPQPVEWDTDALAIRPLEHALLDESVAPFIQPDTKEEEKVLRLHTKPEQYTMWARRRAYGTYDKSGRFIGYSATTSPMLVQERQVVANTITRLGDKFFDNQVAVEALARIFGFVETGLDTPIVKSFRATSFRHEVTYGKGSIKQAYDRLEQFVGLSDLTEDEIAGVRKWMDNALQDGDESKLNRLAILTLAHELKRARHFQVMHDNFARYAIERKNLWRQGYEECVRMGIYKPALEISDGFIKESTKDGKDSWLISDEDDWGEEELDSIVHDKQPTTLETIQRLVETHLNNDAIEQYWRKGLAILRNLGQKALDSLIPPESVS